MQADLDRPAPVDTGERLHTLDILRGFALFGMILVHFHQHMRLPAEGLEDLISWAVWIFVEQKAWGTFAFLFGVGFAVLLRRLDARGARVIPVYTRRLAALACFGLVAHVAFGFHILFEYAFWGAVLLVIRRLSTRSLLVIAACAACAQPLLQDAIALFPTWAAVSSATAADLRAAAAQAAGHAGYASLVKVRWASFLATIPHDLASVLPDTNLTLFVLGLLAIRHRVLDEPKRHVKLITGWMIFGVLSWAAWWLVSRNLPASPGLESVVRFGLGLVQDQWLCFTYIGAVVLLLAFRPTWTRRLSAFGLTGRMALTNYVLQAAILDVLGSAYGFGFRLRPYSYVAAAIVLFFVQAALSRAWLARYRFGPLEWLWRTVTYARVQRLRRERTTQLHPASA